MLRAEAGVLFHSFQISSDSSAWFYVVPQYRKNLFLAFVAHDDCGCSARLESVQIRSFDKYPLLDNDFRTAPNTSTQLLVNISRRVSRRVPPDVPDTLIRQPNLPRKIDFLAAQSGVGELKGCGSLESACVDHYISSFQFSSEQNIHKSADNLPNLSSKPGV